jgi:hypothetical protein
MVTSMRATSTANGVTIAAYRGDGGVLLAFDLDQALTPHLAGFAVQCAPPQGRSYFLSNRLNFAQAAPPITSATTAAQRRWWPSDTAPLQKFRWVHFPSDLVPGAYTYTVTAMYFPANGQGPLVVGPSASVPVEFVGGQGAFQNFRIGFTRGMLSSQAYAHEFNNADIRPPGDHAIDYDTAPFANQYAWLGFHARPLVFDFLDACLADPSVTVDVFAYDLDEPDIISKFVQLGDRLRIVLDNSVRSAGMSATQEAARAALTRSAGAANIVSGKFGRFAHDKVLIRKQNGQATKVLTGSANFSVRGLYAQSNNVLVFDDPQIADAYARAFQEAFTNMKGFAKSASARQWFDFAVADVPACSIGFAPHPHPTTSLDKVASAIQNAHSSVLYAVMQLGGGGTVLENLRALNDRDGLFSYGITQSLHGINLIAPGKKNGIFTDFEFLAQQIPPPFDKEISGGLGQIIHHKFVVVDFNDAAPIVFTGSSNLASGGEEANGDNLLAIADPHVATMYAVEAIRLVDHYHFRAAMKTATDVKPLQLKGDDAQWWAPYYNPNNIRFRDRTLFTG